MIFLSVIKESTLSLISKPTPLTLLIIFKDIRSEAEEPGLKDYEIKFLRMIE